MTARVYSGATAVLDAGKTHTKLTLWAASGERLATRTRANASVDAGALRVLDVAGIERWLRDTLAQYAAIASIDTVIPVGHGAAAAYVHEDRLLAAPMDYEQPIPADVRAAYDALRDRYARTGSPALPGGLNLGAQLYWREHLDARLAATGATIVPWPQYWAWVLSGIAASEVTSLGCHTDLWCPALARPSSLATTMGWDRRLAPLRHAGDVLGTLRPQFARSTGLSPHTRVLCGIHDSNAALLCARAHPQLAASEATVVSTGTWFVAMRTPSDSGDAPLDERRDCLWNVDADGRVIPSARFMGGRELELLTGQSGPRVDDPAQQDRSSAALAAVVRSRVMALPTLTPGVGPYPTCRHDWRGVPADPDARATASALYAALVLDASLALIGARGPLLIEGRFARAELFVRALASLRADSCVYVSTAEHEVSFGALRLVHPQLRAAGGLRRIEPLPVDLTGYASEWRCRARQSHA